MRLKNIVCSLGVMLGVTGCSVLGQLAADGNLFSLGAIPASGFSDVTSSDYGKVTIYLGQDGGAVFNDFLSLVELESEQSRIILDEVEDVSGKEQGNLLLLADGSASLEQFGCLNCPTDPMRQRVEAIQILTTSLHKCAPEWNIALHEFGNQDTRVVSDYTQKTQQVVSAADELVSFGGTPLWDSLLESLESMHNTSKDENLYAASEWGQGIVVVSDGEDTESWNRVEDVIALAQAYDIPVNAVGLASSSDIVDGYSTQAIEGLRQVALETGGFYAAVSTPTELPKLANYIAQAYCDGYSEVSAQFVEPPASGELVSGVIKLKGTDIGTPFTFRAP